MFWCKRRKHGGQPWRSAGALVVADGPRSRVAADPRHLLFRPAVVLGYFRLALLGASACRGFGPIILLTHAQATNSGSGPAPRRQRAHLRMPREIVCRTRRF